MQKLLLILTIFFGLFAAFGGAFANYDAFGSDGPAPTGGIQHYIPTTHYIRMGAGVNIGGVLDNKLTAAGAPVTYEYGLNLNFALGLNIWQMLRAEFGWERSYYNIASADTANMTVIFDLARRYRQQNGVIWHKTIVPFVGVGAVGGWAEFNDAGALPGGRGWIYGWRGLAGIGLYLTETNAIDIMATYNEFHGHKIGWDGGEKTFGGLGVGVSWRVSF